MKRFQNILSYIPHTATQNATLDWCKAITNAAAPAKLEIVTCIEDYLPEYPEAAALNGSVAETMITLEILATQKMPDTEIKVSVDTGNPLKTVASILADGTHDLLIITVDTEEDRLFAEKLARKSPVGVLIVPLGSQPCFDKVLFAADFSDMADLTIQWAEAFAGLSENTPSLEALHVMSLPRSARASTSIPQDELRKTIHDISSRKLSETIEKKAGHPELWTTRIAEHLLPSLQIMQDAEANNVGLIVTGSHGKSALATALLGGQTADIIRRCTRPLLVVKQKNKTLGILRQLLGLDS